MALSDDTSLPSWFQVFRGELNRRLDRQDGLLERIDQNGKLTNGRVSDIEHREDERTAVEAALARVAAKSSHLRELRLTAWRWKVELAIGGACIIAGGIASSVGHVLKFW